jgi:hypothetical protein
MRVFLLLFLAACAGTKDSEEEEGTPGGPCTDGSQCISGEYCLILDSTKGAEGLCTVLPDGCDDACDCKEVDAECGKGMSCFAFGSDATVQCM